MKPLDKRIDIIKPTNPLFHTAGQALRGNLDHIISHQMAAPIFNIIYLQIKNNLVQTIKARD